MGDGLARAQPHLAGGDPSEVLPAGAVVRHRHRAGVCLRVAQPGETVRAAERGLGIAPQVAGEDAPLHALGVAERPDERPVRPAGDEAPGPVGERRAEAHTGLPAATSMAAGRLRGAARGRSGCSVPAAPGTPAHRPPRGRDSGGRRTPLPDQPGARSVCRSARDAAGRGSPDARPRWPGHTAAPKRSTASCASNRLSRTGVGPSWVG